jgi:hypothetical protein
VKGFQSPTCTAGRGWGWEPVANSRRDIGVAVARSRGSGVCQARVEATTTCACEVFLVRCCLLHATFHRDARAIQVWRLAMCVIGVNIAKTICTAEPHCNDLPANRPLAQLCNLAGALAASLDSSGACPTPPTHQPRQNNELQG